WRSTDYGVTWTKVNTGNNGDVIDTGRPWTAAIDPNPTRDPSTLPALYTVTGYAAPGGIYKSIDGGVNWTHHAIGGDSEDVYSLDIDPYDSDHLIAGFHGGSLIAESTNGGVSWTKVPTLPEIGNSLYPFFVDTGEAAETRSTWVTIAQWE